MRIDLPWIVVPLALGLGLVSAKAEDRPIPNTKTDALSLRVLRAWERMEYRPSSHRVSSGECLVWVTDPSDSSRPRIGGIYRFTLSNRYFLWDQGDPTEIERLEWMWWRLELDTLCGILNPKIYDLDGSHLTAEQDADGTRVRIRGPSGYHVFRFDAKAVHTGLTCALTLPSGGLAQTEVDLTYRKHGNEYLLRGYTMSATKPDGGTIQESGRFEYRRLLGLPFPSSIYFDLTEGDRRRRARIHFVSWKVGDEAGPEMDDASRAAFAKWERDAYSLGRDRVWEASCRVEARKGRRRAIGRYVWKRNRGRVTWEDADPEDPHVKGDWHGTLDRLLVRYPLRRDLANWEARATQDGGRTIVLVRDVYGDLAALVEDREIYSRRIVFDADGRLASWTAGRTARDPECITSVTYRRVASRPGTPLAASLRYHLPVSWTEKWSILPSTYLAPRTGYTVGKSMSYAVQDDLHVPKQLTLWRVGRDGKWVKSRTFLFSGWNLTREPRTFGDPADSSGPR